MTEDVIREVNTFGSHRPTMKFGDFILFQEYDNVEYNHELHKVSKPRLVIYLGMFVADQTIGFNYIEWVNENKPIYITNSYVTNRKTYKQVGRVKDHVEWDEFIDIIGHWAYRPSFKELITAFRKGIKEQTTNVRYIDYRPHLINI